MAQLLENAWMGTVLILAVAALRRLLRGRLPAGVWLCLWAVCLVRLFSPASLGSPLSLYALAPEATVADAGPVLAPAPAVSADPAPQDTAPTLPVLSGDISLPGAEQTATAPAVGPAQVLLTVYLIGAACVLVWLAAGYVRARRAMSCAIVLPRSDPRYAGLPRSVRVAEGPVRGAPLTFGVVHPVIALPPGLSGAELEFILAHEGAHARRRDNLWNYAVAAALVLYWWDPAVWLMARLIRRDVELSCDRAVLRRLGPERRGDYARALLAFATQGEDPVFSRPFGQKQAEERIIAIMRYKKLTAAGLVLALVLVCGVTAALATSPPEEVDSVQVVTGEDVSLSPEDQALMDLLNDLLDGEIQPTSAPDGDDGAYVQAGPADDGSSALSPEGQALQNALNGLAEDANKTDLLYEDVLTEGYHYLTAEEYIQEMDAFFAVVKDGADQEYYDSLYAWAQFTLEAIRSGRANIGVPDLQANNSDYVYLTVLGDKYTREMPTDNTTELSTGRWTYRVGPEPTTKEAASAGFHDATPEEYERMIELYRLELTFKVANNLYTQEYADQSLADCEYTLDLIRSGVTDVSIKDYWVDTMGHMIYYSPD